MKNKTSTSKKVVWMVLLIILAILAITLYEMMKFKPVPPITDTNGEILSVPENAVRHFKSPPEFY